MVGKVPNAGANEVSEKVRVGGAGAGAGVGADRWHKLAPGARVGTARGARSWHGDASRHRGGRGSGGWRQLRPGWLGLAAVAGDDGHDAGRPGRGGGGDVVVAGLVSVVAGVAGVAGAARSGQAVVMGTGRVGGGTVPIGWGEDAGAGPGTQSARKCRGSRHAEGPVSGMQSAQTGRGSRHGAGAGTGMPSAQTSRGERCGAGAGSRKTFNEDGSGWGGAAQGTSRGVGDGAAVAGAAGAARAPRRATGTARPGLGQQRLAAVVGLRRWEARSAGAARGPCGATGTARGGRVGAAESARPGPRQHGSATVTRVAALGGRAGAADAARGRFGPAGPVRRAGTERAGEGCRRERVETGVRSCRLCSGKMALWSGGVGTGWRVGPARGRGGVTMPCVGGCRRVGQPTGEQCGNARGSVAHRDGEGSHSASALRGGASLWPTTCWCV